MNAIQSRKPAFEKNVLLFLCAAVLVALAGTGANLCLHWGLTWPCPARTLFGLPCPSCGGTRALAALVRLDLGRALACNPLLTLLALGGCVIPFFRQRLESRWSRGWPVFFGAVLLNWLYLVVFLPP